MALSNEGVLNAVDIHVGDCRLWKLFPKLDHGFFQSVVEILGHLVERAGATKFVYLGRCDGESVQNLWQAAHWACVVYPKRFSPLTIYPLHVKDHRGVKKIMFGDKIFLIL